MPRISRGIYYCRIVYRNFRMLNRTSPSPDFIGDKLSPKGREQRTALA